jgi:hypothetical protein
LGGKNHPKLSGQVDDETTKKQYKLDRKVGRFSWRKNLRDKELK